MVAQYELTDRFGFKFGARAEQVETYANLNGPELTENDSVNVLTYLFKKGIEEGPYDPDYFKILPSINGWCNDQERIGSGVKVDPSFRYSSDNNSEWMEISDLEKWLEENYKKVGK